MQHKTANSVRLGHSPRPHPCVGYITNDITSSGSDTNGNSTGKYASSASKLTSTHTQPKKLITKRRTPINY